MSAPLKVLQVAAEVFPLVKTGGLADVVGALPQALNEAGADVRLVLPGLPAIADAVLHQKTLAEIGPQFGAGRITLSLGQMPFSHVAAYVVHAPYFYRRTGSPYQTGDCVTIDGAEGLFSGQQFAGFAHLDRATAKAMMSSIKPKK